MLSCVGIGLAIGLITRQIVLPTVDKIHISELIISEWAQGREHNATGKRIRREG
jgi:hypothetical protein